MTDKTPEGIREAVAKRFEEIKARVREMNLNGWFVIASPAQELCVLRRAIKHRLRKAQRENDGQIVCLLEDLLDIKVGNRVKFSKYGPLKTILYRVKYRQFPWGKK